MYSQDQTYDALDELVADGVIANYGVSVETCDEALTAMSRRGTATVQIILNAFPPQAARGGAALGDQERGRDHRPGSAGERPVERRLHHLDHLRRK